MLPNTSTIIRVPPLLRDTRMGDARRSSSGHHVNDGERTAPTLIIARRRRPRRHSGGAGGHAHWRADPQPHPLRRGPGPAVQPPLLVARATRAPPPAGPPDHARLRRRPILWALLPPGR